MQLKESFGSFNKRLNLVLWQPLAGYGSAFIVLISLLIYRLGTLVPAFSIAEKTSITNSLSLRAIFENPLYAPYELWQYIGLKLGRNDFVTMRLASVIFAVGAVVLLFYIVNRWFNFRVALITTILFATSSWFLNLARLASPEITMIGLLVPLAYAIWLPLHKRPLPTLFVGAVVFTSMLHIPGFVWFAIAGLFWQRKELIKVYKAARIPTILTLSACIIVCVPLFIAAASDRTILDSYLGLPGNLGQALVNLPKNLVTVPYNLIISGPLSPQTNLGKLPFLDFFTSIMMVIGAYSYTQHAKLRRSQLLLAGVILSLLLISLKGSVSIYILMPFVYLLVASGLNYMVEQWFKVFPYNPFARNIASVLIVIAVATSSFYHVNRYFVAWPQAPATKQVFNKQP